MTDLHDRDDGQGFVGRLRQEDERRLLSRVYRICQRRQVPVMQLKRYVEFARELLQAWPEARATA